jgi:ubiquinone/menaquinone biosynthesis C-methylase UbiE
MDFGGDIGLWQRKIAEGLEGTSRRLAVFEALAINSGQAVLDLGCGGGHLVRDIALAVGDSGRVAGLDASNEQIIAARSLCADLNSVELMEGDATNLPFEDASFDCLASIQMLEYVPEVDSAISEARRVMKPGSKAALVSVLWDHWRFHGADPELNNEMHEVWRKHCFHQMLPMEIPTKLEEAGFDGIVQKPIAFMNNTMHENAFSLWAAKLVAAFAVGNGVDEKEATLWLEQLDTADTEGRFGFVSVPVLTTAIATSS